MASQYTDLAASIFPEVFNRKLHSDPVQRAPYVSIIAICEVLHEQNLPASPTSFFTTILQALSVRKETSHVAAELQLLSILGKNGHVPAGVGAKIFKDAIRILLTLAADHGSEHLIIRPVIDVIGWLLITLPAQSWKDDFVHKVFNTILDYTVDHNSKIRKKAQSELAFLFSHCSDAVSPKLAKKTGDFVCTIFKGTKPKKDCKAALYGLSLLKMVDQHLTTPAAVSCIEAMVNMLQIPNTILTMTTFNVLASIFANCVLPPSTFSPVLKALLPLKPAVDDVECCKAFVQCTLGAHTAFAKDAHGDALEELNAVLTTQTSYLQSESEPLALAVQAAAAAEIAAGYPREYVLGTPDTDTIAHTIKILMDCLGWKYKVSWDVVISLCDKLFCCLATPALFSLVRPLLKSLGEIVSEADFHFEDALHRAIGAAIASFGPENVLEVLPLNLLKPPKDKANRAWLLPLLKNNIRATSLSFFPRVVAPLLQTLEDAADAARADELPVQAKNIRTLIDQLWALLPPLCIIPTDGAEAFTNIAQQLGETLQNEPARLHPVAMGLITLIESNCLVIGKPFVRIGEEEGDDETEGDTKSAQRYEGIREHVAAASDEMKLHCAQTLEAVGSFARQFLPLLFNLCLQLHSPRALAQDQGRSPAQRAHDRAVLLECIRAFSNVAPADVLNAFFKQVVKALLESTSTPAVDPAEAKEQAAAAQVMADLAFALSGQLDESSLDLLARVLQLQLGAAESDAPRDHTLQKKAYRLLDGMIRGHPHWVKSHVLPLTQLLVESGESVGPGAKRARLRCLTSIFGVLPDPALGTVAHLLVDIVLAAKEVNSSTREAAYSLLLVIAHRFHTAAPGTTFTGPDDLQHPVTLEEFLLMLLAGLAGKSPHMISASVLALSRVVFEFRDVISPQQQAEILSAILILFNSRSHEIVRSALGFVKVIIASLDRAVLEVQIQNILEAILKWAPDNRDHFRTKVRVILERLVRKFGAGAVLPHIPQELHRFFTNIRKEYERKEKKKKLMTASALESQAAKRKVNFAPDHADYEEALYGSEDEENGGGDNSSDDEDTWLAGLAAVEAPPSAAASSAPTRKILTVKGKKAKKAKTATPALVESAAGPVDLLDDSARFAAKMGKTVKKPTAPQTGKRQRSAMDVEEEEKLTFIDPEDYSKGGLKASRKRKLEEPTADDDDDAPKKTWEQGQAKGSQRKQTRGLVSGREFKAKRAKGDVKKGKFEPYAYIPLDPGMLNKRSKTEAKNQFKNVIGKAKHAGRR